MDEGVRERHGVSGTIQNGSVNLLEDVEAAVIVKVHDGMGARHLTITTAEARYLADRLYQLANKVDKRNAKGGAK